MIKKHMALVSYMCDACKKNKTASAYIFGGRIAHGGKVLMLCDNCANELVEIIKGD